MRPAPLWLPALARGWAQEVLDHQRVEADPPSKAVDQLRVARAHDQCCGRQRAARPNHLTRCNARVPVAHGSAAETEDEQKGDGREQRRDEVIEWQHQGSHVLGGGEDGSPQDPPHEEAKDWRQHIGQVASAAAKDE